MKNAAIILISILSTLGCVRQAKEGDASQSSTERTFPELAPNRYNVAFLIMNGTYNTEFTAPYDIFQHTQYRQNIKAMNTFIVANTLEPITTFEGVRILPDFDYTQDSIPPIDILVVPSAEHHLDSDLKDTAMLNFVKKVDQKALFVTSHCDGAFVLAKAGLLDSVVSTTFPSDIEAYKTMFPKLKVKDSVLFVHDGKYITSAGGAKSFEAALYLCEQLYGKEIAESLAKGLVIQWKLSEVPHLIPQ
ncbi:glutamine amidotransferase [Flavobacteriaceae bacterium TP-CH-4]|uniref:Glutamine amidotransferase n=1 Tax=Pelagihabitans pacificus TaxID=2696054 RepID=A0A967AWI3_9FLAO|nr:DJ-1/PfpI family protein [Pelagihabitans pacificus]NHF57911.1 glutamine amidotransferase [Pelagihabitans pacificus]